MVITDVDVVVLEATDPIPMGDQLRITPASIIVRISTDGGLEGFGAATANIAGGSVGRAVTEIRPLLVGQDPLARERIWQRLLEVSIVVLPPQVLAGVDCALWDLAGRHANMPIFQLLGGYRDRLPCYVSTPVFDTVDEYLGVIDEYASRGFKAVKIHPWGDPARDIRLCTTVRGHVGDDVALMLDAVGAYDVQEALKVGRALEALDFEWFEMPIRDQALFGYQQLAAALDIAITSGEVHSFSFQEAATYLMAHAWDFIRVDASIAGGITGAKKAAALAEGFGVRCELHSFGYPLSQAANLHVAGAIANCRYFEVPVLKGGPGDAPECGITIDDLGEARLPTGAGLGVDVDWDAMLSSAVAASY
jgi:L-alanine-DL-glutamate epimerase-like enolase superfamily enzyme